MFWPDIEELLINQNEGNQGGKQQPVAVGKRRDSMVHCSSQWFATGKNNS